MKKVLALLATLSILGFSPVYAGGLQEKGLKPYQGAGIGKEVSTEAKELKETGNKTEFGETVKTKAQDKTRIQKHKELIKQRVEEKKGNQTGSISR